MAFAVAALAYALRPPPGAVTTPPATPPALCTRVATRVRLRLLDSATAATGTDGFATAATETVGVATAATAATGTAGFATAVANAAGFAAPELHACPQCGQPHPSRNQLYAHLRANRATCGEASGLELASGAPVRLRKHVLSVGYGACGGGAAATLIREELEAIDGVPLRPNPGLSLRLSISLRLSQSLSLSLALTKARLEPEPHQSLSQSPSVSLSLSLSLTNGRAATLCVPGCNRTCPGCNPASRRAAARDDQSQSLTLTLTLTLSLSLTLTKACRSTR
eukprot:scaffold51134_cov72-Phaeocystis_antarctica.AAC.2